MAASSKMLLLGALCLPYGASAAPATEDPGWELFATSAGPEVPRTCIATESLPEWLRGSFIISGPALFERNGVEFQSLFDGFGRVNRFEMRDRQVCFTSRWLNTGTMRAANASHDLGRGVQFMDTTPPKAHCPLTDLMCDVEAPNDNNWVNLLKIGDTAVLLSDTHKMLDLDMDTLNVTGIKPWTDDKVSEGQAGPDWVSMMHVPAFGSAHPLPRPGTHEIVDILVEAPMMKMGGMLHALVDVYTFQNDVSGIQKRTRIASIKAEQNQYFHSFGVTPNYVVLPFDIGLNMFSIVGKPPTLLDNFIASWKGIHIVDYKGGEPMVFDTEPFYHTHVVNTFENATGVVLDTHASLTVPFGRSPALVTNLFLNKTARDSATSRAFVRRLHFHLAGPLKGQTTIEDFSNPGRSVDFFKINDRYNGLPYCIYYAVEWWHDGEAYASMAILKHDTCKGTRTYWTRPNTYPGEPFFAPRGGADSEEDDGAVIFHAIDGKLRRNVFFVLDAKTMTEVSSAELPVHIPFTAHGQFLPDQRPVEHETIVV